MRAPRRRPVRAIWPWAVVALALVVPVALAATSPLLQWRAPVYIAAGFAGILAMGLMVVQPMLVAQYLPGIGARFGRTLHAFVGSVLLLGVLLHIGGLWITSPPDVIDVLLLRSPTPFSIWGVLAMWALIAAAMFAGLRRRLRVRPRLWRRGHATLTLIAVAGTILHVLLIEGTMETVSKYLLSGALACVALKAVSDLRIFTR